MGMGHGRAESAASAFSGWGDTITGPSVSHFEGGGGRAGCEELELWFGGKGDEEKGRAVTPLWGLEERCEDRGEGSKTWWRGSAEKEVGVGLGGK